MKERIQKLMDHVKRNPWIPALLGMGWNLLYAIFNGVLGIVSSSYWYITLCAFYLVLGLMRLLAVTSDRRKGMPDAAVMRLIGFAMILLAVVISGITLLTIREQQNPVRDTVTMITIATFTFLLAGLSVRNIIRAYRKPTALLIILRNISCAAAVGSMLSLERGMLGSFGDASDSFTKVMEAVSGAVAFLLLVLMGIGMLRMAKHRSIR